eukprot:350866-Chlamydomonas_euryale.AAC.6
MVCVGILACSRTPRSGRAPAHGATIYTGRTCHTRAGRGQRAINRCTSPMYFPTEGREGKGWAQLHVHPCCTRPDGEGVVDKALVLARRASFPLAAAVAAAAVLTGLDAPERRPLLSAPKRGPLLSADHS